MIEEQTTPGEGQMRAPASTERQVEIGGTPVRYLATAGLLPLKDAANATTAEMFYIAYARRDAPAGPRPITFLCNGGPGSSSIWLHMGSFGPVRVSIADPGSWESAPYRWTDNSACLLDATDLVFLDAVGTGYSRAKSPELESGYFGIDEDAGAFESAIATLVQQWGRYNDPKFLLGESFGAMRAAIVAHRLHGRGIDLNGLILLSGILSFAHFAPHLDQHAIDLLPSFAASAWYHGRTAVQTESLESFLASVREFARGPYASALAAGHNVDAAERNRIAVRLEAITGIARQWWVSANLRARIPAFRRELLRDRHVSIGASDSRFTGEESDGITEVPSIDAAQIATSGAFQSAFGDYNSRVLLFPSDRDYIAADLNRIMGKWNWAHTPPNAEKQHALASVVGDLSFALRAIPRLKLLVLCGYFDLVTPFFGMEYDLGKLYVGESTRKRIAVRHYRSGHMLYLHDQTLASLASDIRDFYTRSLGADGFTQAG